VAGPARVLYLHSSSGHYGADRQLQLLATGIDRRRYQPLVVLPGPGVLADALRHAGVEVLERHWLSSAAGWPTRAERPGWRATSHATRWRSPA
jgi:hypothetical protein